MSNTLITMFKRFIISKAARFDYLSALGMKNYLSDEDFLKRSYFLHTGNDLNLDDPVTFTEKLQWLKIYNRNPLYTELVDKYDVKKYVSSLIGEEHVIPTLAVWNDSSDIDISTLPDSFVLKCTHDSHSICKCQSKCDFDFAAAKRKLNKHMRRDYYQGGREWPYKNVPHRIIAEPLMGNLSECQELMDYKFFCFDGEPLIMYMGNDGNKVPHCTFFDMNFTKLDLSMGDPPLDEVVAKPKEFNQMKIFARKLSQGIPHVRVDFYIIDGVVYFGEYTFFHNNGFSEVKPDVWNDKLGSFIDLDAIRR